MRRRRTVFCDHLIPARECRVIGCRGSLLTPAEAVVAGLVARGLTNAEIARERGSGLSAVKAQVRMIMTKLDVASRSQIAVWWVETQRPTLPVSSADMLRETATLLTTAAGMLRAVAERESQP